MKKLIILTCALVYACPLKAEQNNGMNIVGQVLKDWTRPHYYGGADALPQGAGMDSIYNARVKALQPQQQIYVPIQPQQGGFGNFGDSNEE